eukprot:comp18312_c0_seq1/m.19374 comp18312_c0_seq1/g.19374  ORF comp18312_c0_seq1/g.19374 comp18312_c0_seq1/m.19374 type:complete len:252 (-) comp18312_c0_seq1:47-802(-)
MSTDIKEWFESIPPVTKVIFTASFGGTLLVNFGIIPGVYILLDWDSITSFEIWRLVTCFFFFGKLGFNFLVHMMFLYQYSRLNEEETFEGKPADYVTFLLFCALCLLPVGLFVPFRILGISLMMCMVYLWSQINKDRVVSFFFGLRFKAMYFPWVLMGFNVLMGGYPILELAGVIVGHLYYFLAYLYPETNGKTIIFTPEFLKYYFPERRAVAGMNGTFARAANPREQEVQRNAPPARGHTWGTGQRLGNN